MATVATPCHPIQNKMLNDELYMSRSPSASSVVFVACITSILTSTLTVLLLFRLNLLPGFMSVAVPSVLGMSERDARAALQAKGFGVTLAKPKSAPSARPGTVVEQVPAAGASVSKNSVVTIALAGGSVQVPQLVGLSVAEATMVIEQSGFQMQMGDPIGHPKIEKGKVALQVPKAGSNYSTGRTITLSLSDGPSLAKVPKLVGMQLRMAKRTIVDAGFRVGKISWSYDENRRVFAVIDQDPASGAGAQPNSEINLVVNEE